MSAPAPSQDSEVAQRNASSFRDPNSHVVLGKTITRIFQPDAGAQALEFLNTNAYRKLTRRGDLHEPVSTKTAKDGSVTFEHTPISNWNYPWEWTWSMLRDAALVHLEILLICAQDGWTMSDATSFNLVFSEGRAVFIDHGSFIPREDNDPWWAYTDFCEHFLYPLLVATYTDARLAPQLRGGFGRVTLNDAYAFLKTRKHKRGVLKYVLLPYFAASKSDLSVDQVSKSSAEMTTEIFTNVLDGLHGLISSLDAPGGVSTWSEYASRGHYSGTALDEKGAFVDKIVSETKPTTVLDIGANDGHFSAIAAAHAEVVIAADGDPLVVDQLYASKPASNILPLVQDATNPSPAMGWRSQERTGFFDRIQPDLVLALAVFHHVAFTGNVPLEQLGLWMSEVGADFLVEFVHREDEKVQHLLSRKTDPDSFNYGLKQFIECTDPYFEVAEEQALSSGTRSMLHLVRR